MGVLRAGGNEMHVAAILKMKGRNVVTTTADKSLLDVAKMLEQHDIGCIVIAGDAGQVSGVVSERDLVRAIGKSGAEVLKEPGVGLHDQDGGNRPRGRSYRPANVRNDGAPVPPYASGRARPANRPRPHWRCGQDAHRGSRHGGGSDGGVRSLAFGLTKHPG